MKALANSVVFAVAYINCLPDSVCGNADNDVRALESLANYLANSTDAEKDALAVAAQLAFEQERIGANRVEFLEAFGTWMESMFGNEWKRNQRV